jgi:hypothetical protein
MSRSRSRTRPPEVTEEDEVVGFLGVGDDDFDDQT